MSKLMREISTHAQQQHDMYMYMCTGGSPSRRGRAQLARRSRAAAVVALSDACGGVPHVMGEEHLCDEPLPIARRGKGGIVDGERAVDRLALRHSSVAYVRAST